MTGIVIDTHVLIWYVFDINRLSDKALTRLDNAVNNNELMYLTATALYLQLPLITRDLKIQALSNIQVIW